MEINVTTWCGSLVCSNERSSLVPRPSSYCSVEGGSGDKTMKGASFNEFYVEELQAFIGLQIAMGLLKLPQIKDYWCKNEIISTPGFPAIMPRDRFFTIMRYLH